MKVKKQQSLIFHASNQKGENNNATILRITINREHTKIDFGYQATSYYTKGGWIKMNPNSFVEVKETKKRYQLTKTDNIPIAPARLDFETTRDWRYFSLYFEPIPLVKCIIDVIEEEDGTPNDFNYYQIKIDPALGLTILEE